jgi:uncharacterized protein (DUF302 family)
MLYTVTTNTDINTIKNEIEEKAKEVGFGVLKEYAFKDILKSKGHPIEREIIVYELCNPAAAQEVLTVNPEVSVYLPCRISVYEKDSKTVISTISIEDMLNNFDVDKNTKEHMSTVFNTLKTIMSQWGVVS